MQFLGQEVIIEKAFRTRGMSLNVNSKGQVTVKLGYCSNYSDEEIQKFVEQHKRFLKNRLTNYSNVNLPDCNNRVKVCLLDK